MIGVLLHMLGLLCQLYRLYSRNSDRWREQGHYDDFPCEHAPVYPI